MPNDASELAKRLCSSFPGRRRPVHTFMLAVHCWRVYDEIKATDVLKKQFLAANNQCCLFTKVMERATVSQLTDSMLAFGNYCTSGHDLQALVVQRFFNCVAKNMAKELTGSANADDSTKKKRKSRNS